VDYTIPVRGGGVCDVEVYRAVNDKIKFEFKGIIIGSVIALVIMAGIWHVSSVWKERKRNFIGEYIRQQDVAVFLKWCDHEDLDWIDMLAMTMAESGGKWYCKHRRTHAEGYVQLIPATWRSLKTELKLKGECREPDNNFRAGFFHFRCLLNYYAKGNVQLAIELYCCGTGNYSKGIRATRHMSKWMHKRETIARKWRDEKYRLF
jgi:hypothetical protein